MRPIRPFVVVLALYFYAGLVTAQNGPNAHLELTSRGMDHPYHDVEIVWHDSNTSKKMRRAVDELDQHNLEVTIDSVLPDSTTYLISVVDADEDVVFEHPEITRMMLNIQASGEYRLRLIDDRFYRQAQLYFRDWDLDTIDKSPWADHLSSQIGSPPLAITVDGHGSYYGIDFDNDNDLDIAHYGFYESEVPVLRVWINHKGRYPLTVHKEGVLAAVRRMYASASFSFTFLVIEPEGEEITTVEEIFPSLNGDSVAYIDHSTTVSWYCQQPTSWLPYPVEGTLVDPEVNLLVEVDSTKASMVSERWQKRAESTWFTNCQILAKQRNARNEEFYFVVLKQRHSSHSEGDHRIAGWLPARMINSVNEVALRL